MGKKRKINLDFDKFSPGDYYEDCAYHPCLCISVDDDGDAVWGISLVDGSYPRGCSVTHCAPRKLSFEEAMHQKFFGPPGASPDDEDAWWNKLSPDTWMYWPFNGKGNPG